MKKLGILIVFVILVFSDAVSHDIPGDHKNIKVRLRWQHQFQFAGVYAAQMKGFYAKRGLEVEAIESTTTDGPINAVLTGKADYGIAGTDLIVSRSRNQPILIVAALLQHSPYVIVSEKSKNIKTPADLIGKKLMIAEELGAVQLKSLLKKLEIPLDNIQFVQHTWKNESILNGYADAMSGHYTTDPYQFKAYGAEVNIIRPLNYGVDFYGDMLFTTEKEISEHPERVQAFVEATLEGWEYALSNIEELAAYIATLPGVKARNITMQSLMEEAISVQRLVKTEVVKIGDIDVEKLNSMMNAHYEFGIINKRFNVQSFVHKPTRPEKAKSYFEALSFVFGILIFISIIIFIWNYLLRTEISKRTNALEAEIELRKQLELNSRNSEERLELALSAARLGIWDSDLTTGVVYRNNLWSQMLGYNETEIAPTQEGWQVLVHPNDWPEIQNRINAHHSGRNLYDSFEHRLKSKNGEWKWILSMSKIVSTNAVGRATRLIGIHIDIDDIKQKELQMQRITEELMYTNAELEKFAYITSHNLRAPVVNLLSLVDMMQMDRITDDFNQKVMEKVQLSVARLEQTLNDLIEIVSAKKLALTEKRWISIAEICGTVLANLEKQISDSKAVIQTDFQDAQEIYYVRGVLESILQNLLTNSIKYRHKERSPLIKIYSKEDQDYVYLHVEDNGMGFDASQFGEKIFKLYERIHYSVEGKGLGLYLIKTQVEALGGKVEVCSKPDAGATFIISIKKLARNDV